MPSAVSQTGTLQLPTINLAAAVASRSENVDALAFIREACKANGFFVISNHGISADLQTKMIEQAKDFFDLPLEQKLAVDESLYGRSHRGYQRIGGEGNEPGKLPDLKEGFQYGRDQPVSSRMLTGPNLWPTNQPLFKEILEQYFQEVRKLSSLSSN